MTIKKDWGFFFFPYFHINNNSWFHLRCVRAVHTSTITQLMAAQRSLQHCENTQQTNQPPNAPTNGFLPSPWSSGTPSRRRKRQTRPVRCAGSRRGCSGRSSGTRRDVTGRPRAWGTQCRGARPQSALRWVEAASSPRHRFTAQRRARRCGTSCRHRLWSAPPAGATARCEERAGRRAGRAGAVSHKMVGGGGDRNAPSPATGWLPPAQRLGRPRDAARRAFGQQCQGLKCKCKVQLSPVFALCKTHLTARLWETTYKRFKTRACLFLVFYLCKV